MNNSIISRLKALEEAAPGRVELLVANNGVTRWCSISEYMYLALDGWEWTFKSREGAFTLGQARRVLDTLCPDSAI